MEVGPPVVKLAHKCATLKEEASKDGKAIDLEKEIILLKGDFLEARCLKDGAISKTQIVMEKVYKFSFQLTEMNEAEKKYFEDARNVEKRVVVLAKERDVALQKIDQALSTVERFKKTPKFARITYNHCLARFINIYGCLVTQIKNNSIRISS